MATEPCCAMSLLPRTPSTFGPVAKLFIIKQSFFYTQGEQFKALTANFFAYLGFLRFRV
jgi:hypothetical protein